jgi:putative tricarboxylic transport membrane protein
MRRDAAVGAALALLSVGLLWQTREIPHPPLVPIGPAFYPRVVLTLFLVLSLLLMVSGLRAPRAEPAPPLLGRTRLVPASFALFGLYVLAMPVLGYLLSTALFTIAMQWLLGRRGRQHLVGVLAVGIGTAVGTWLVFERYLYVLLPRGVLLP